MVLGIRRELRLALASGYDPRTVRCLYRGRRVLARTRTDIERAARRLRLPPPPPESGSAPCADQGAS